MSSSSARVRTTRISKSRVLVLLLVTAAVGWFGFKAVSAAAIGPLQPGPSTFSGYVDVTATPAFGFETPTGAAQSDVTLSFVVSDPQDACEPAWGGYYSLDEASDEMELDRRIVQLASVGGHVRVSFGGQANTSLAVGCTDDEALLDAYRSVVERYDLDSIDLDVEGAALDDSASIDRRANAIAALQEERGEGDPLAVWLTLPVDTAGLTAAGQNVVRQTLAAGVDLAGVNGMAMNFGAATSSANPQSDLVAQAMTALQGQVDDLYTAAGTSLSASAAWGHVGMTVMIGQNDVSSETFTIADAERVNQFALDHGVGLVGIWSLNRDATCESPLPTVTTVVQTSCSGVNQDGASYADTLAANLPAAQSEEASDRLRVADHGAQRGVLARGDREPGQRDRRPGNQPVPDLGPARHVPRRHQDRVAQTGLRGPVLDQRRRARVHAERR
ncbi:chitinase [Demequina litorisediminis]|uniref:Bifunctional chitinase/lysozyme n=1 Tax=Demequina litorisediminis TaxID=1849022 RepID=A0ABQ6II60_9MICO|nr:chitinase [Demequina litorisediminis]GMA37569.1 hypothetical protein GCM10025876_37730 [Demequina litorisediminis]